MSLAQELRGAAQNLREHVAAATMSETLGGEGSAVAAAFGRQVQDLATRLNEWAARAEQLEEGRIPGARAIEAQEEERRRLAREIHDGPAQILANVVFRIDVGQKLLARDPARAATELEQLKALVRRSLQDVRRIIFDLRPMVLDDLGLAPALRDYVAGFGESGGVAAAFDVSGQERRLPPAVELAGFRVVQEALANVRKHAAAEHVVVRLTFGPALLRAEVIDDGAGFDPDAARPAGDAGETPHYGLRSMRERVALLGGRLDVRALPGQGTRIVVEFPLGRG